MSDWKPAMSSWSLSMESGDAARRHRTKKSMIEFQKDSTTSSSQSLFGPITKKGKTTGWAPLLVPTHSQEPVDWLSQPTRPNQSLDTTEISTLSKKAPESTSGNQQVEILAWGTHMLKNKFRFQILAKLPKEYWKTLTAGELAWKVWRCSWGPILIKTRMDRWIQSSWDSGYGRTELKSARKKWTNWWSTLTSRGMER